MARIRDILNKYLYGRPSDEEMEAVRVRQELANDKSPATKDYLASKDREKLLAEDAILTKKREKENAQKEFDDKFEKQQYTEEDEKRQSEANIIIKKLEDKEKADRIKKQLQEKGYYQVEEPEIDDMGKTMNYEDYHKKMKKDRGY